VRVAAADALSRLCVPETCGVLAGALYDPRPAIRRAAAVGFRATLPRLTPEHYGALDTLAVPNLCRVLQHPDTSLALAALTALEKVGDGRALPFVARAAQRGRSPEARALAARVLPLLQERLRQEQDRRILLRGASAPPTDAAWLLRAADRSEPPEQLLRPLSPMTPAERASVLLRSYPPPDARPKTLPARKGNGPFRSRIRPERAYSPPRKRTGPRPTAA
jgi:hypothetical protein